MPKYCICYSCKNRNNDVCGRYPEFVDKDNKDYDPEFNINCGEECTGECETFYCHYYERIRTQPGSFKDGTWEDSELKNEYDEVWGVRYQRNVYQVDFDFEEKMRILNSMTHAQAQELLQELFDEKNKAIALVGNTDVPLSL